MLIKLLAAYCIAVNLIGFISMGRDKRRAVRGLYRTPEKRLFLWALLGGSLGSMLGMALFRHKTRHLRFALGMPLILLAQAILVFLAVRYL
jgi:uncharacterized membrane protein YsdA (DUF1294 family)